MLVPINGSRRFEQPRGAIIVATAVLVAAMGTAFPPDAAQANTATFEHQITGEEPDPGLQSAVDTRRRLGLPADPSYVARLMGSVDDAGTKEIGLPLTATELAEVKRREVLVGQFFESLEAHVRARPDFGGVYVDQLAGGIVAVLTTGDPDALEAELHEAQPGLSEYLIVRQVTVSAAQLEEAAARLFRERREWAAGIPVFEVAVDHQHTRITVRVPPDQVAAAARLAEPALSTTTAALHVQDADISISIEAGEQHVGTICNSRTDCYSPLRPGIKITPIQFGSAGCTMAFHIVVNGIRNALTAGHCSGPSHYHYAYGLVGVQTSNLLCSGSLPYIDIKRISVASSQQTSGVYGSGPGTIIHVTASAWPIPNATLRGSLAQSNALRTGIVTAAPVWYTLAGFPCDLIGGRHNLASIPGDSGSPLWLTSPNRATGVLSSATAFGEVQFALDKWNANVYS